MLDIPKQIITYIRYITGKYQVLPRDNPGGQPEGSTRGGGGYNYFLTEAYLTTMWTSFFYLTNFWVKPEGEHLVLPGDDPEEISIFSISKAYVTAFIILISRLGSSHQISSDLW